MARPHEDDNEAAPVEKKRRRPRPKPENEDDEGPGRRQAAPPQEEGSEEPGISTGNILLDIVLDFRDDCIDWARENTLKAMIVAGVFTLCVVLFIGLTVSYIVGVMNRPTLPLALAAYDYGSFVEAKIYAEGVLKYTPETEFVKRAGAMFVLGAANCTMADHDWTTDRQPYYLTAANYLKESEKYGFIPERKGEGYYLLGKSLYMSGELEQCREPLLHALEMPSENSKAIRWILANSYFLDNTPNYAEALRLIREFRKEPTVTEIEGYEADLLESMILLQLGDIAAAEQKFARVPTFEQFRTMREFVSGQIAFFRAREFRESSLEIEHSRQPISAKAAEELLKSRQDQAPTSPSATPTESPVPPSPSDSPPSTPTIPSTDNDDLERLLPSNPSSAGVSAVWDGSASVIQRVALLRKRTESVPSNTNTPIAEEVEKSESSPSKPLGKGDFIVLPPPKPETTKTQQEQADEKKSEATSEAADPRFRLAKSDRERAEIKYKEAIAHFKTVVDDPKFFPRWRRQAELLTGISYDEMGDESKAQEAFATLYELSPSTTEAIAAEFFWAEIERRLGRSETAAAGYVRAFDELRKIPNYANPWLPKSVILERSSEAFRQRLQMKEYKEALSLLKMLNGVMPEKEIVRSAAEVYEQWAEELKRQADASFLEQRTTLGNEAKLKYRLAAEAYGRLAALSIDTREYDRLLWQSAEDYRLGKDYRYGIPAYKAYMKVNTSDRQPEALVYVGEMYIHLDGLDEAIEFLNRCIHEYPNHVLTPRARLDISRAYAEKGEWDKAKKMLEQNLIDEYSPQAAIYRDSIYALGKLLYESGEPLASITYFEDAIKNHPNAVQAADAHYCLAQAFLKRSDERTKALRDVPLEATKRKIETDSLADQALALDHLLKTEEMLVKRQDDVGLSEAERLMLRNTIFCTGMIQMNLKRYEQAILTYDLAATRYMDRPESLDAMLQIAIAYRMLGRSAEAIPVLNRATTQLEMLENAGLVSEAAKWKDQIQTQKSLAVLKD